MALFITQIDECTLHKRKQSTNTFSNLAPILLTFFILLYKRFWKTWAKTIAIPAINIRIESTPVLYTQQSFMITVNSVHKLFQANRRASLCFCLGSRAPVTA